MEASTLLKSTYVEIDLTTSNENTQRIRPSKGAAIALLARTYLYTGNYSEAEKKATELIDNASLYELVDLSGVFLMNNKEAIWQLQPVGIASSFTANTMEGQVLKLPITGPNAAGNPVYLREHVVNSFDPNDLRKINWINSVTVNGITYFYPNKYKIGRENVSTQEYSTVLRLGEQYLIRAEARIQQNKIADGIADLNVIRRRATDVNADPQNQLYQLPIDLSREEALEAVENERRFELFTEWGHRWFDLKRTKGFLDLSKTRADETLSILKGANWQTTDQLFPIPQADIDKAPNLIGHQNPGY